MVPGSVGVQASRARTTTSAVTAPAVVRTTGARPGAARDDVDHLGVLVDVDAAPFDRLGQAAGEEGRLDGGAVRGEGGPEHPLHPDRRLGFRPVEPAQVVFAEAEGAGLGDLGQGPGALHVGARGVDGPPLGEVAVDPFGVCGRHRPTSTVACMARRMARMASRP